MVQDRGWAGDGGRDGFLCREQGHHVPRVQTARFLIFHNIYWHLLTRGSEKIMVKAIIAPIFEFSHYCRGQKETIMVFSSQK